MRSVLRECFRVLRRGRRCVVVVGTNNNHIGRVLKVPADQVAGLHQVLRNESESLGLSFGGEIPLDHWDGEHDAGRVHRLPAQGVSVAGVSRGEAKAEPAGTFERAIEAHARPPPSGSWGHRSFRHHAPPR